MRSAKERLVWFALMTITCTSLILGAQTTSRADELGDLESSLGERLHVRVEAGPVWQSRNEVQIPNDAIATRFSLSDLIGNGPAAGARLYVGWRWRDRHEFWALAAPFQLTETATSAVPIDFAGSRFTAGDPIEATYQFNSWRISYRYRFQTSDRWKSWVGLTAKLRDARIELSQGTTRAKDTDLGFVPLLHLATEYRLARNWIFTLDADALGGGPGRAIDASVQLRYSVGDRWYTNVGYRTLEGGADVDAVYNFAWLHYAVLGIGRSF
jgi:hypothetical protein